MSTSGYAGTGSTFAAKSAQNESFKHRSMKRFTETEKWKDPWFRKLSAGAKLAFFYIVENCDNAGVWTPDKELADFCIGMEIPWEKVLEAFGDRVLVLKSGDWLVTKFIGFQFGELSEACKPHLQVLKLIEKHRVSKGYPKGIHTLKDTDKDKDKEGSAEGNGKNSHPLLPTLHGAKAYAPLVGIDPKAAEVWWLDCDARGLSSSGHFLDGRGQAIHNWQAAMTSYGRKWQANDQQRTAEREKRRDEPKKVTL